MTSENLVKTISALQLEIINLKRELKVRLESPQSAEDLFLKKILFFDDFSYDDQIMLDKIVQELK